MLRGSEVSPCYWGLAVAPLPRLRFAVPRLDLITAPGFCFDPSPDPPAETNDFLVLHWPEDSPYRWMPGAEAGNAEALHRLAEMPWLNGSQPSQPPTPPASDLTVDKVVELLKSGVPADTVLHDVQRDMKQKGTLFHLTPADGAPAQRAGASATPAPPPSCSSR